MGKENQPLPVVLSADDDADAHLLLRRAFNKAEVPVFISEVHDGEEVIRYLEGRGKFFDRASFPLPQLLILDLKMPKMSGFQVLEHLQHNPALTQTPVVVFSSSNRNEDVQQAYGRGCHSYVVKPGDFETLRKLAAALAVEFLQQVPAKGIEGLKPFSNFVVPRRLDSPAQRVFTGRLNQKSSESPEMFRILVEQVKDYAIFLLSIDGIILSWNEGARRIKGYEEREIVGRHFSTFYLQADIDADKPGYELKLAIETGRYEEEGWRLRKDGSRFWANVIITSLRGSAGELLGFAKVTRDLTQRKLNEENFQRLLESEERFRVLVEQVKDYAIFILDARGFVSSWNQGARRIKGYSSEEIIGKHFSAFYPQEDIQANKPSQELSQATRDGRYEEEGWRIRKDGTRFWASVVITALWDKRGNLAGFAKVTRDLSQRKREEEVLRQRTQELEAFAHTLSHDLRAPLRSISSFAHILKNEFTQLKPSEQQVYVEKIFRASQSMENLINDILKLSQVSLSRAPETLVDMEEVLGEAQAMLESEIKSSRAQIEVRQPLPRVLANRTLLVQIFANLLSNGIKFAQPGRSPQIVLFAEKKDGMCALYIKDHGVGIPECYQESIFNLFERGAAEPGSQGTGVGLAIVKKAVERVGGSIAVRSKEGEGTEFVVSLPCEAPHLVCDEAGKKS